MVSKSVIKKKIFFKILKFYLSSRYKLKRSKHETPSSSSLSYLDPNNSLRHASVPLLIQDGKSLYNSSTYKNAYDVYMSSIGYHQYPTNHSYENCFRQQQQITPWSTNTWI
jgi:hypothetical protein